MKVKCLTALAVGLFAGVVFADTAEMGEIPETGFTWHKKTVVLGEWTGCYDEALKLAKEEGIPLIAFFGRRSCGNCKALERKLVTSEAKKWFAKRKFILLCGIEGEPNATKVTKLCLKGSTLPFVGLYWDRNGDGKSDGKDGGVDNSAARKGGGWCKSTQAFIDWVEPYFKDYISYDGGAFAAGDAEYDRLECESGTKAVPVDLFRENASGATSNKLIVRKPNGKTETKTVTWAVGETSKTVDIDVKSAGFTADGQQIEIELLSDDGVAMGTNHITYVKKEVSAANPLWLGERKDPQENGTAPDFAFGEWTMDLDLAKRVVAKTEGAFTLVSIQGSMWCPDCANTDRNFLEVKNAVGENVFQKWAKANKVALVAMDVPNYNKDGATPETVASPTLFSKKAFATTLARAREYPESGADPALTNAFVRSGRGYLTRKGATDEQAAEVMAKFHDLANLNTDKGGFHRPEDTNMYRTGVPIFVLLRRDGSVAARFLRFASASPMKADRANVENYLKRFDEMLAIAGAGETAHADVTEIANNYPGEGSVPLTANGGYAEGELCHADVRDTFKLEGFKGNALVTTRVRGESETEVTVAFWQILDGSARVVSKETIKSGKLSEGVTLECELPVGEYYADVQIGNDAAAGLLNGKSEKFIPYSITSAIVLKPSESVATAKAPAGSKSVSIVLDGGVNYRITGLDPYAAANSNAFELVTGGDWLVIKAKSSGTKEIVLEEEGGEISYQKWAPGTVGFAPVAGQSEVTVRETEDVRVDYRRIVGISGDVTLKVSLNLEESDFFYDWAPDAGLRSKVLPRFLVNGVSTTNWSETVDWKDGRALESCVSNFVVSAGEFETHKVSQYFGPGKVVFDLEIVSQTEAGVYTNTVDYGRFTINFTENEQPSAGRVQITGCKNREWMQKRTVYAHESEAVEVVLSRIDAAEGVVYADLKKSVNSVTLGGDYDPLLGVGWANRDVLPKTVTVTNLPAAGKSVKLTLTAESPLKVDSSADDIKIVSVADDAPAFERTMAGSTIYRYVAVSNAYAVIGTQGGALTFSALSGKLPSGLTAAWNGDAANPALVISGVPTGKDGAASSVVYQVTEKRGSAKVPGLTIMLDFRLVDPEVSGGSAGEPLNASCAKSRTFKDLMVLQQMDDGTTELFGTLQLTLPANGKASAKLLREAGTVAFSAKSWSGIASEGDGSYSCVLVGMSAFSDWQINVEAEANGAIRAELYVGGSDAMSMPIEHNGILWSASHSAADCAGSYTVTFEDNKIVPGEFPDISGPGADFATDGSGYLTLSMPSSQAKSGTMKWAGVLPNGTKVSGSTVLTEKDGETVLLPVVKISKKDSLAGALAIERGGAEKDPKECWESVACPVVNDSPVLTRWSHFENSKKTDKGDFTVRFRPYGGIFDSSLDLGCCCKEQRKSADMILAVSLPKLMSDYYGAFEPVAPISVKVAEHAITRKDGGPNAITVKYDKKTGVISGKFNLFSENGKKLSARYRGVVQLGFGNECGCKDNAQPFVNGSWHVTDKIECGAGKYLSVSRGGKLVIDVLEAP